MPYELRNKGHHFTDNEKDGISAFYTIEGDLTADEFAKALTDKLSDQDAKDAVLKILDEAIDNANYLSSGLMYVIYKRLGGLASGHDDGIKFFSNFSDTVELFQGNASENERKALDNMKQFITDGIQNLPIPKKKKEKTEEKVKKVDIKKIEKKVIKEMEKQFDPETELLEINKADEEYTWFKYDSDRKNYWDDKEFTVQELADDVLPHLNSTIQKNTFIAFLNAVTKNQIVGSELQTFPNAIKKLKRDANEEAAAKFTETLGQIANREKEIRDRIDDIVVVVEYADIAAGRKVNKAASKGKNKESVKETLNYSKRVDAPDLDDANSAEWVKGLRQRAKDAKGRLFDSDEYKDFYEEAKITTKLAELITSGKDDFEEKDLDENLRLRLSRYLMANQGEVSRDQLKEAYERSWNKLQECAEEYEKRKLETEGFTRDPHNRNRHQLKSRSKEKFKLMDEMFYPEKRKIHQKDNQIQM